jgi:hypothetical protein
VIVKVRGVASVASVANVVGMRCMGGVEGVAEIASSIHINSTVLFFFLLSSFPLSSNHPINLWSYRPIIFVYLHISYLHVFKNAALMNSMHSIRMVVHTTEGASSDPGIFWVG